MSESPPTHLVQLLVPIYDNDGRAFPAADFSKLRDELTGEFGGLTAYTRAPAQGTWAPGDGKQTREDIVVYEVMVGHLDRAWWATYRQRLERRFQQRELVIRAQVVERL